MRFTALLFVLVTGCVGQIESDVNPPGEDGGTTPIAAKAQYVQNVHVVLSRCSGAACHSLDATASGAIGKFYDADPNAGYNAIVAAPSIVGTFSSISPIITKIDAGHQTVAYSPAEKSAIVSWLSAETLERADDTQPPPADPATILKAWSACMTIENFNTAQMAEKFGAMAAGAGQACRNCHGGGTFGFTVSNEAEPYFALISTSISQHLKYFTVQLGVVKINTGSLTNAGTTLPGHPPFDPINNLGMPALQQFYDLTLAAQTAAGATGCGIPKLVNP